MTEKQFIILNTRKGHLSRAINSLNEQLVAEVLNVSEITKYSESVSLKLLKYQEESEKYIDSLDDNDEIEKELDRVDKLQDSVTDLQIKAREVLAKATSPTLPPPKPSVQKFQSPKLPELAIEKFNGDVEKYQEFLDSFNATIHNNPKLEAVDKFRYLRMFLDDNKDGDGPKSLIAGFSTTADNYEAALNIIKETYGKKERIIMSHVSKLLT